MSFEADMSRVVGRVRGKIAALLDNSLDHAMESIKFGSPITGAPGQPVDSEDLRKSYQKVRRTSKKVGIVSDRPYAEIIENNRRGARLRSVVGGFHSIKLTRLGWGRIVAYEARKLKVRSPGIRSSSNFEL